MSLLLEVREVSKTFGGVHAVDAVSFELNAGDVVGLIGPNGAGKSTLVGLVAGSVRPSSGQIVIEGHHIERMRPYQIARLGVGRTHQTPRPFGRLTVRDNLRVATASCPRAHSSGLRVDDVLSLTGLVDLRDRHAGSLTLLQLKRLELARALAQSPSLLLLDEIGAGLTPGELRVLTELLEEVRVLGTTMIVIEHVIDFVMEVVDRVLVLDRGRLAASGTPDEVASSPVVVDAYLGTGTETPSPRPEPGPEIAPGANGAGRTGDNGGSTATPLLSIEDMTVDYGKIRALADVSLEVPAGQTVAVLGPNGAGKSTLCRALLGLLPVTRGRVYFDGTDITGWPTEQRVRRSRIALCPEGRHVFATQSVRENLALGCVSRPRDENGSLELVLELFPELAERLDQNAGTLSGGQQQMLAIGRALMAAPRMLVVDELSLGLTPEVALRIYDSLRQMLSRDMTLLVIEQHVGEALRMATTAYVLERGHVVFGDSSDHILANPHELAEIYVRATGSARAPGDTDFSTTQETSGPDRIRGREGDGR